MASCGCALGIYTNLKSLETQPNSRSSLLKTHSSFAPKHAPCISPKSRLSSLATSIFIVKASSATAVEDGSFQEADTMPTPKVFIDQDSDPDATAVEVTFGDRLGALLDTMAALRNLGLNVVKANVYLDSSGNHNKFAITKAYFPPILKQSVSHLSSSTINSSNRLMQIVSCCCTDSALAFHLVLLDLCSLLLPGFCIILLIGWHLFCH